MLKSEDSNKDLCWLLQSYPDRSVNTCHLWRLTFSGIPSRAKWVCIDLLWWFQIEMYINLEIKKLALDKSSNSGFIEHLLYFNTLKGLLATRHSLDSALRERRIGSVTALFIQWIKFLFWRQRQWKWKRLYLLNANGLLRKTSNILVMRSS